MKEKLKMIISLESTCDLPKNIIEDNDLKIVDMNFMIDGVDYSSSEHDVVSSKLYSKMKEGAKTSTSQVNEHTYIDFFTKYLEQGKNVLHLCFSSGLSATYSSALSASEKVNKKYNNRVYVLDTQCACSGQGLIALIVSDYAKNHNFDETIFYAEKVKTKISHLFTVDNLKYLANGGRIKKSSAMIGNILQIKPVMRVDDEGKLIVVEKVMARRKALKQILATFDKTFDENYPLCYVSHADCVEDAEYIKKNIYEMKNVDCKITNLGPIIGCHSGPGTLALFFVSKFDR